MNQNPFSLLGKRILITGASSGIGRACAQELSKLGAEIVAVARRHHALTETMKLLAGDKHHIVVQDLTCGEELVEWMADVCSRIGPLDGLVHSAGFSKTMPLRATSSDLFSKILKINLESSYFLAKAFRQRTVRSDHGSIVFVGSVMSVVGQPGLTAYSASKGALVSLTKSLAIELAPESIRINLIAPGHVATAMAIETEKTLPKESLDVIKSNHPLGIGRPEDVAYGCAYLLSDAARWVTGTTLIVDGGYTAA